MLDAALLLLGVLLTSMNMLLIGWSVYIAGHVLADRRPWRRSGPLTALAWTAGAGRRYWSSRSAWSWRCPSWRPSGRATSRPPRPQSCRCRRRQSRSAASPSSSCGSAWRPTAWRRVAPKRCPRGRMDLRGRSGVGSPGRVRRLLDRHALLVGARHPDLGCRAGGGRRQPVLVTCVGTKPLARHS